MEGVRRRAAVIRAPLAGTLLVLAACGGRGDAVVVYSSFETEVNARLEAAFSRAHEGERVRIVAVAAGEALERVRGEAASPRADLWIGAPSWTLSTAAAEGLIEGPDTEGRWVPLLLDPLMFAFASERVPRSAAPRDWIDVRHARWSGELVLVEPEGSEGMKALLAHHLHGARARHGDVTTGLDWFARMDAWRRDYVSTEAEAVRRLRTGEGTLAFLPLSVAEAAREAGGVDHRVPESETPAVVLGAALLTGAPHGAEARAVLAWVASPEAAMALATAPARVPVAGFADADAPAWWARVGPGLRTAVAPADSVATELEAWVTLWRDEVRGRAATPF